MIDGQKIETGLYNCGVVKNCNECPYCFTNCNHAAILARDALEYIKSLKSQLNTLKQYDGERDIKSHARLIEKTKKETAKDILLSLRSDISQCYGDYALEVVDGYIESYGVEVDK